MSDYAFSCPACAKIVKDSDFMAHMNNHNINDFPTKEHFAPETLPVGNK